MLRVYSTTASMPFLDNRNNGSTEHLHAGQNDLRLKIASIYS